MAFAAKLFCDDRAAERYTIHADATVRDAERNPVDVVVEDLSSTGFRIATSAVLAIGDTITLGVAGLGVRPATIVREDGDWYGCAFASAVGSDDIARVFDSVTNVPLPFMTGGDTKGERLVTAEPEVAKYPGPVRLGMLVTLSVASWAVASRAISAIF